MLFSNPLEKKLIIVLIAVLIAVSFGFINKVDSTTYYYIKSKLSTTANSVANWGEASSISDITNTNTNNYCIIVPLTSGDMYAIWIKDDDIQASIWDDSDSRWEDSAGNENSDGDHIDIIATGISGTTKNISAVSDSDGYVHLIYIDYLNYVKYQKIDPLSFSSNESTCNSLSGWHWYITNNRPGCWSKSLAELVSWNKGVGNDTDNPGAFTCAAGYTLSERMEAASAGEWYKIVSEVNSVTITSEHNGSAGYAYISALAIADCVDGARDLCTGDGCTGASDWSSCNSYYRAWAEASGKSALPYLSTDAGTTQATNDYWDACSQSGAEDQPLGCISGGNFFYFNRKVCNDGDDNYSWAAACGDTGGSDWNISARMLGFGNCALPFFYNTSACSNTIVFRVVVRLEDTAVTLDSTATNEYATIAIDTAGNNGLYAFWTRDNDIYYSRGCSPYESDDWDSAEYFESAGGNSNDWSVAGYEDFSSGKIFAQWTQGAASPYSVEWKSITPTTCVSSITVSGYAYENETPAKWDECDGETENVKISVEDGTTYTTTCNTDTGYFEKTLVVIPAADKLVSVYMEGETEDGVSVTLPSDTTSDISINVYKDILRIESVSGTSLTNAKLAVWDSGEDEDVLYTVDGSNNLSTASTVKTYINTGDTYAPGANVSTGKLEVVGTYTGVSETLTLSGSGTGTSSPLYINSGTFTTDSNTTVFTGSSESDIQHTNYNNLELKPGGNATYHLANTGSQTITINGNLTIGNESNTPTIDWTTYDPAITLKGSLDLNSPSVWTKSDSATLTWTVSGTKTWSDDNGTKQNLGIVSITGGSSTPIIQLSTGVKAFTLAVADGQELALNSQNLDITNGALTTAGAGTITCSGCSAGTATILETGNLGGGSGAITFYNLNLGDDTETGTTTAASDFTVSSIFTIAGGSNNHIFNGSTKTVTLAGSSAPFVKNGTFTYSNSTIKYAGASATNITSATYYNVEFTAGSGTPTYTLIGAIDVENDLTIGNSDSTLDVSGSYYAINVGGSWSNSGTFTSQEGTVTFDSADTGETINTGGTGAGKTFYNIVFNNSGGGWTIDTNDLTATNNFTLTDLTNFDASSRTITVGAEFKNNVGGDATTWTGSTLVLDGSGNYCINDTKNVGGDAYATFNVSAGQYIRMWDSSASAYNVSGTLYSMDHGANDGYLYIWGAYEVPDSATDYWSYSADFDSAGISRQCQVTIQSGASVTVGSGEDLEIKGGETASNDKTTVTYAPASGSWSFNNDTGSELIIQEAKIDYMKVNSGEVTVLNTVLDSSSESTTPTEGATLNNDWYVGVHLVNASTLANIETDNSTDVVISENSGTPQSTVWKYDSGSWGSASTYQETGTGSDGKIPQPGNNGAIRIREYSRTSSGYTFYYYNFHVKWQSSYGEYDYYEWAGDDKYIISGYYSGGGQDNVIGDSGSYDWHREDIDANNTEPSIDDPPAFGTFYCGLRAGLDFEIVDSDEDSPPTLELGFLEEPNFTSTDWLDLKVETSASHGYMVTAWALSDYTPNVFRHTDFPSTSYIQDFSGAYPSSLETWTNYCKDDSNDCGFGYTSNDPLVEGSNNYNSGNDYAKFASSGPGNVISDYSQPVSKTDTGGTYRMTVKASVPVTQLPGDYSTTLIFICTAQY